MSKIFRIGDVYLINFSGTEHEQCGVRPGVVFQNNIGNIYSPNIIALPITSSAKKLSNSLPTHVKIYAYDSGLIRDSVVLCENPTIISKSKCGDYLTTLPIKYMREIAIANLIATSSLSFIEPNTISGLIQKCISLNNV